MAGKMTDVEWEAIGGSIMTAKGATLLVDGLKVQFKLVRLPGLRLGISFFIDGQLKADWGESDCPERRLFCRPVTKSVWTAKAKAQMARLSMKELKKMGVDPAKKRTVYYPWWTDFKALRRHLLKNATSIERVDEIEA